MGIALLCRYQSTHAGNRRVVDDHKESKRQMGWRWGGGILDNLEPLLIVDIVLATLAAIAG